MKPGTLDDETIEIPVGEAMVKIGFVGAGMVLGAIALGEAKAAIVEKITEAFGKYQTTKSSEIEQNDLDDTPDATRQPLTVIEWEDEGEVSTTSVMHKKAKFEALASEESNKNIDTEQRPKKTSMEEMLEAQREEYQHYMKRFREEERIKHKEEMRTKAQQWRQQNLETEAAIRQKDTEITALQKKDPGVETIKTDDPWHGKGSRPRRNAKQGGSPTNRYPHDGKNADARQRSGRASGGDSQRLGQPHQ